MQILTTPQVVSTALSVAGVIVALVLLSTRARGRSRVTGIIGAALMLLGAVSGLAYLWLLAPNIGHLSDEALIGILAARTVVGSVLTGIGVVLLTCAVVVRNRRPRRRPGVAADRTQPPLTTSG